MKLFKLNIEVETLVVAETREEAENHFNCDLLLKRIDDPVKLAVAREVKDYEDIPLEWYKCIPWDMSDLSRKEKLMTVEAWVQKRLDSTQ